MNYSELTEREKAIVDGKEPFPDMMNLDTRQELEKLKAEREATASANTSKASGQDPTTQPGESGGKGRMFTQDEVNKIISERLAREREKQEPESVKQREKELAFKESRLKCRDYLERCGYPADYLDVFPTENYVDFVKSVDKVLFIQGLQDERRRKDGADEMPRTTDGIFRRIFGLK